MVGTLQLPILFTKVTESKIQWMVDLSSTKVKSHDAASPRARLQGSHQYHWLGRYTQRLDGQDQTVGQAARIGSGYSENHLKRL